MKYDHSDISHCLDWDPEKCPESCFRAKVTKDLKEKGWPYPVDYSRFLDDPLNCERTKKQA